MKKEQLVEVTVDDFDHESPAETQTFEFQGQQYEIDLADWNVGELRQAQETLSDALDKLRSFVEAGRPVVTEAEAEATTEAVKKASSNGRSRKSKKKDPSDTEVREWARANDIEVNRTGRVPKSIKHLYQDAHA